jgi:hypothetical protein
LSSPRGIVPLGLVSLWDMFNFNVIGLIHLLWMLDFYERATLTPKPKNVLSSGGGLLDTLPTDELSDLDKETGKKYSRPPRS